MSRTFTGARSLCRIAVMTALYVPLARMAVEIGTLKISLGSLPVVVLALLCGPVPAALAAFLGEFLKQMLSYGFTATTLLWLIPPALRGLLVGLAAERSLAAGTPLERRTALCLSASLGAAVAVTLTNTLVIWLDSVLYGYYSAAYVFGNLLLRIVTGVLTALLVTLAAMPVASVLRRQGLAEN